MNAIVQPRLRRKVSKIINTDVINSVVSYNFGCTEQMLFEKSRRPEHVEPRQVTILLYILLLAMSETIAARQYMQNHATANHAKYNVRRLYSIDKHYRLKIDSIFRTLARNEAELRKLYSYIQA